MKALLVAAAAALLASCASSPRPPHWTDDAPKHPWGSPFGLGDYSMFCPRKPEHCIGPDGRVRI